jgi:hypothetical protein
VGFVVHYAVALENGSLSDGLGQVALARATGTENLLLCRIEQLLAQPQRLAV